MVGNYHVLIYDSGHYRCKHNAITYISAFTNPNFFSHGGTRRPSWRCNATAYGPLSTFSQIPGVLKSVRDTSIRNIWPPYLIYGSSSSTSTRLYCMESGTDLLKVWSCRFVCRNLLSYFQNSIRKFTIYYYNLHTIFPIRYPSKSWQLLMAVPNAVGALRARCCPQWACIYPHSLHSPCVFLVLVCYYSYLGQYCGYYNGILCIDSTVWAQERLIGNSAGLTHSLGDYKALYSVGSGLFVTL